jgi:hypothetical protein
LAYLIKALSTLILAFESIFHALRRSKHRDTAAEFFDAIIDAQLIFRLTIFIAFSGAIISFQETSLLPHYWDTALI